jgi:hypothetical protein
LKRAFEPRLFVKQPSLEFLFRRGPFPVLDLGFIETLGKGVVDAFDDLPLQPLLQVRARFLQFGNAINNVDRQVEAVHLIANRKFQRSVDVALFLVAPYMNTGVVRPPVRELVD